MTHSISPWSPYEGRSPISSVGRLSLTSAFADLVLAQTGFSSFDLPEIFAFPVDEGENDASRDLVRLQAELLAEEFVSGRLETFSRPIAGGTVERVEAEKWEIDDPLPRFSKGAFNTDRWADPDAEPTHRLFVNADEFHRWLVELTPPGFLTDRQMEAIADPRTKAARALAQSSVAPVTQDAASDGRTPLSSRDGLGPELLTIAEVRTLTSRGRSTIYQLEREGKFPSRIKLGKSSRWKRSEVEAWIREQIARGRP
jgi:predicted DNA-binding transcriptional regulator AlpA